MSVWKTRCRAQGNPNRKSLCCLKFASTCRRHLISWCAAWMLRRCGWRSGISSSPCPHLDSTLEKKAPVCFSTETLGVRKRMGSGFSCPDGHLHLQGWLWPLSLSVPMAIKHFRPQTLQTLFLDLFFFLQFAEYFFKRTHLFICTHLLLFWIVFLFVSTWAVN